MAVFFFHVIDGTFLVDTEGTECAGVAEIQEHAVQIVSRIVTGSAGQFPAGILWHLYVTTESKETVFKMSFTSEWTEDAAENKHH